MIYRFDFLAPPSFELRLAVSALSDGHLVGSRVFPIAVITPGCQLDTVDPVTTAVLNGLALIPGGLLEGVTISPGVVGAPVIDYDALSAPVRAGF
jgi:hypothetical protein